MARLTDLLVQHIMSRPPSSAILAIVGGTGAGKSWLADRLSLVLGEMAGRVSLDNFYRDRSHLPPGRRERINYDSPAAIDWVHFEQVLTAYRFGNSAAIPRYDFITHCRISAREPCPPRPLMIVEGPWLLQRARIRRLFDLRIFLDCPERMRLRRRLERDVIERGRTAGSVRQQFRRQIIPMHERHVEPQRRWADVVLPMPYPERTILDLAERIWHLLRTDTRLPDWMRATFRAELLNRLKTRDH